MGTLVPKYIPYTVGTKFAHDREPVCFYLISLTSPNQAYREVLNVTVRL